MRKMVVDFNRGDLDTAAEAWDDDMVVRTLEGWPERVIHGKAAVRSFFEQYRQAVGHDVAIEDLIGAGNIVVGRVHAHLSGERSGIEGDQHYTQVTTLRHGKVVLVEFFWDHHEALEAAGVEE